MEMSSVSPFSPSLPLTHLPSPHAKSRHLDNAFRPNSSISKSRARKMLSEIPRFAEKDAFPASLPLHTKNPHIVYHDIQRFAREDKLKEALTIMDYLDQRGVPVNVTTLSALIASCVRTRSLELAKQVHAYVRVNGLEKNEFLRTKLVSMYTTCGSIEDADKLFDQMPVKNAYTWNALLRGNVMAGKGQYRDALWTFSEMREGGVELNAYSFSCLIKSMAGASAFTQGLKAHGLLIKNGLLSSQIVLTCLIDMYFKCGKVRLACQLFEEISIKDIVVWGTMVAGFAHNNLQREAVLYIRQMISEHIYPNSVLLTTILPVIGEIGARKMGKELHAYVIKTRRYSHQLFIQSALIDMYCKCGDLSSGRRVFYACKERNTISWTALISGYISNGKLNQALRAITWMQKEGFKPDVVTVATVVPVCAELRALKSGKELHAFAVKNCFFPNISIVTSLMVMYAKCGHLNYSSKLFYCLEKQNVISWTAMIDSCIAGGHLHGALEVFRSMQSSKHRPDSVTMARALLVCSKLKASKLGKEIHGQILKKDLAKVPFVSAELVKMYGMCGEISKAKSAFHEVPVKGSMTKTAIIEAYGYNTMFREAIDLFKAMVRDGFTPNQYTFSVLLSICKQALFTDEARRIFKLMTRKFKIEPSKEHYLMMVEILTQSSCTEDAKRFEQMSSLLD
uniref:Pentatricopeptide repeat-containing protein n=1 Tax=Kalanchoe fedtschenkoi TaxID=63787 RepID=A0A7N0TIZ0_KALFE